jgi:hypothetical protein
VDDLVGLVPSNHGTTNPGASVTGETFCDVRPAARHHLIPYSALAIRWTVQALGRPGPADPADPPPCA